LGELTYSLTDGLVSALDRLITTSMGTMNMFQTNCVINSGNSGGPIFNSYGEVIGIATAKYGSSVSASGASVEGIGFGIPINDVKTMISDLIKYGYVTGKPYMGIQMQSVPQNAQQYGVSAGAYITSVASGSAAERAGLKEGDIIVAVDETTVDSSSALNAAVSAYRAGDEAKLTIVRSNERMELTIIFDEENEQTTSANQLPQEQIQAQQPQNGYQYFSTWPFGNFFF
jgi:serine protease Do